jgi:DNA-binding MurR/RpiR family transcriptional regulator
MDVLDLMETKVSSFTKTDLAIYEYLKRDPEGFAHKGYDELVEDLGISPSSLIRFAKKLGYTGYASLQYQLGIDLEERARSSRDKTIGEVYCDYLLQAEKSIDRAALDELAGWVEKASRVYCMGFYLSNLPARFLSVGLRALHAVATENPEYDYLMRQYRDDELIILFSVRSGEKYRAFLKRLAGQQDAERPRVVLVTMSPKNLLRSYCDSVIVLPSADSVGEERLAIIDNMMYMMFNEMLMTRVGELKSM